MGCMGDVVVIRLPLAAQWSQWVVGSTLDLGTCTSCELSCLLVLSLAMFFSRFSGFPPSLKNQHF
jgi:hypothetical protein